MTIQPPQYLIEHEVIFEEPWCRLYSGKDLANWSKEDEIKWNQTHRQTLKYKFYIKAFDLITVIDLQLTDLFISGLRK